MSEALPFGDVAPAHLHPDVRTVLLADMAASGAIGSLSSMFAALLAELVGTLHEVGTLPEAEANALALRWSAILRGWTGAPEAKTRALVLESDLATELHARIPGHVPPSPSRPARATRHRAARQPK